MYVQKVNSNCLPIIQTVDDTVTNDVDVLSDTESEQEDQSDIGVYVCVCMRWALVPLSSTKGCHLSGQAGGNHSEPLPSHLNVNFVCLSVCASWTGSILALNIDDSYRV